MNGIDESFLLRKIIIGVMGKGGNKRAETQKLDWKENE